MNIDNMLKKALGSQRIKTDKYSKQIWFAPSTRIPRLPQRQPQPYISQSVQMPIKQVMPQKLVGHHIQDDANEYFEENTMNDLTDSGKQYAKEQKEKYGRYPLRFFKGHLKPIDETRYEEIKPKNPFFDVAYGLKGNRPEVQNINRGPLNIKLSRPLNREETEKVREYNNRFNRPDIRFPPELPKGKFDFDEFKRKHDEEQKTKRVNFEKQWNEIQEGTSHVDGAFKNEMESIKRRQEAK